MEAKHYKGIWAFGNVPDAAKMHGDLTVSEDGVIKLKVVGEPAEIKKSMPNFQGFMTDINNYPKIPTIVGYAKSEKDNSDMSFTLINCDVIGYTQSGLIRLTFAAEYLIDKCRIHNVDELIFNRVSFRLEYFNEWIGINGFEVTTDYTREKFNVQLDYESPDRIFLFKGSESEAYFFHRASAPTSGSRLTKFVLEEKLYLNFQYNTPQRIDDLRQVVDKAQFLFTLFFGLEPYRIDAQLFSMTDNAWNDPSSFTFYEYLKVFKRRETNMIEFLLDFNDLKDFDLEKIIFNWFDLTERKKVAINLFMDLYYQKNRHVITRFIGYVMMLEVYVQTNRRPLWEVVLKYIFEQNPKVSHLFVEDIEQFAKEVASVRIFYVHGDRNPDFNPIYEREENVRKLSQKVQVLIHGFLLSEIGLPEDLIHQAFKNSIYHWDLLLEN